MTLCDTGPIVALIDADDPHHSRCVAALSELPPTPLITTWPCFTEAMHLLFRAGGLNAQNELWEYFVDGLLQLHLPVDNEWQRMRTMMNQYVDMPLDFADASLVSAAEIRGDRRLFSLDGPLRALRLSDRQSFDIVP
jgi:uncharacterized protein